HFKLQILACAAIRHPLLRRRRAGANGIEEELRTFARLGYVVDDGKLVRVRRQEFVESEFIRCSCRDRQAEHEKQSKRSQWHGWRERSVSQKRSGDLVIGRMPFSEIPNPAEAGEGSLSIRRSIRMRLVRASSDWKRIVTPPRWRGSGFQRHPITGSPDLL